MYQEYKHYNIAVERVIIGVCLHEPDAFLRAKTMVEPQHFFDEKCRIAFEKMVALWDDGMPVDLLTVDHFLNRNGFAETFNGNVGYWLMESMRTVASSAHLIHHCLLLRELFMSREVYRIRQEVNDEELDPLGAMEKIRASIDKAMEISVDDDWIDMAQAIVRLQKHMQKVSETGAGVLTGFSEFDKMTFGLQPGCLHIVAARPGVGKSAFATTVSINAAKKGWKVGIITLEMPTEQVVGRVTSIYSDIEFWRIFRNKFSAGDEEQIAYSKMSEMASLPIFFTDKTSVTPEQIRAKAHRLKKTKGVDVLIIDYLQLVDTHTKKNESREREIAKLSRELKTLAMDLNIPVVALAQLNREAEKEKKPKLYHLRESGSLEQDADMVILLHRDFVAGNKNDAFGDSTINEAEIIVDKHRNGATFATKVAYDPYRMLFHDKHSSATSVIF